MEGGKGKDEGQGLIGLSPGGKQLGPGTNEGLVSGDSRDGKAGMELAADGRETRGIWNGPKGPSSQKMRGKHVLLRENIIYKRRAETVSFLGRLVGSGLCFLAVTHHTNSCF